MEGEGVRLILKNNGNCLFCQSPVQSEDNLVKPLLHSLQVKQVFEEVKVEGDSEPEPAHYQFAEVDLQGSEVKTGLCSRCGDLNQTFCELKQKMEACLAKIKGKAKAGSEKDEGGTKSQSLEGAIVKETYNRLNKKEPRVVLQDLPLSERSLPPGETFDELDEVKVEVDDEDVGNMTGDEVEDVGRNMAQSSSSSPIMSEFEDPMEGSSSLLEKSSGRNVSSASDSSTRSPTTAEGERLILKNKGNCFFCVSPAPNQSTHSLKPLLHSLQIKEVRVEVEGDESVQIVNLQGYLEIESGLCTECDNLNLTFYYLKQKMKACLATIKFKVKAGSEKNDGGMNYPSLEGAIMREISRRLNRKEPRVVLQDLPLSDEPDEVKVEVDDEDDGWSMTDVEVIEVIDRNMGQGPASSSPVSEFDDPMEGSSSTQPQKGKRSRGNVSNAPGSSTNARSQPVTKRSRTVTARVNASLPQEPSTSKKSVAASPTQNGNQNHGNDSNAVMKRGRGRPRKPVGSDSNKKPKQKERRQRQISPDSSGDEYHPYKKEAPQKKKRAKKRVRREKELKAQQKANGRIIKKPSRRRMGTVSLHDIHRYTEEYPKEHLPYVLKKPRKGERRSIPKCYSPLLQLHFYGEID